MGKWENVKQKPFREIILAYLGIFRHVQTKSSIFRGIFRNYSGIFWTLCNPGIFIILVYPKLWHIQNHKDIFSTLGYSEPEAYSEPCQTSAMKRFGLQLLSRPISCPLVHEINMVFNAGLIFTAEILFNLK